MHPDLSSLSYRGIMKLKFNHLVKEEMIYVCHKTSSPQTYKLMHELVPDRRGYKIFQVVYVVKSSFYYVLKYGM
jgi:hypothetical protein